MRSVTKIISLLAPFFIGGCGNGDASADLESRRQHIKHQESAVSDEAISRKARSEEILKNERVPFVSHLPVIRTEKDSKRRSVEEVSRRAIALCLVAVKGEGLEQEVFDKIVKDYEISSAFSPAERKFIGNPVPSPHDRAQFVWRYECYWVMLWALGFVDDLKRPDTICDVGPAVKILHDLGAKRFMEKSKLRSQKEILDAADLIYRYDWAAVNARIKNQPTPAGLNGEVIMERHHALNWLIRYMDQQWDDVSTDT
jgi:hypothetical protein